MVNPESSLRGEAEAIVSLKYGINVFKRVGYPPFR